MAIELPRAGAGSVGAGRPRRARLPDVGDVPTVRVASDPGVRVPDLGAAGRGIEDLGAGISNLGAGLQAREERLAQADARLNARRESVERMRAGRELNDFGNELFTEFESSRDFSKREDVDEYGAMLNAKAADLLESHVGSEESKLRLQEKLGPILESLSDRGGVASVKAQDKLVDREFDEITNDLAARVRLGENPDTLIVEGMQFLDAERDALRPGQEVQFERDLNARVWGAKIDDFMGKGSFDEAENLLGDPEVRAALGEETQRRAFNRIAAARIEGKAKILTASEMAAMGFPSDTIAAGLVVQTKADGTTNVVFNPPRDMDEKVRDKKIKSVTKQREAMGDTPEDALDFAANLVDGNIRIEIVPGLGVAREINEITGEVKEVSLGQDIAAISAPQEETLFQVVERGNTAGLFPAAKELVGRTVGQAFEGAVDPQLVEDRQTINLALTGLTRALSLNPRFPVAEMERIREEIKIAPAVWDSPTALIARMKAVRKGLVIRQANEETAANNPNLPQKTRSDAAQASKDIGNFLTRMGEPVGEEIPLPQGIPAGSTKISVPEGHPLSGKDVWLGRDGKQRVVE